MFGNTFKTEQTNCNFILQANFLWILKSLLFFHILLIFSLATVIFFFNKPNSLKCDRATKNCILNLTSIFDSFDVEIPIKDIRGAKIKNRSMGNTVELITGLDYPVYLSGAVFSQLDNPNRNFNNNQ